MFGLNPDTIRSIKKCFAKLSQIEKVILYGSRAMGNYKNGSDIDITLLGKNLTQKNSIYPLKDLLEELYLPYLFDISIFSQLENPNFIEHILSVGQPFYVKDETDTLPKGWEVKKLGEVLDRGSSNLSLKKIENDNGNYPVFGAKGFIKNISFFQQKKESLAIIKDGAGIGRIFKLPHKSSILATMQFLIPKNNNHLDFCKYLLKSIDFEKDYKTGSTIPHIYYKDYSNKKVFIPPLPEQKQIVAILDKAFSKIEKLKANLEKNLQNSKELFQSKLNNIFNQQGKSWEVKTLGEVCEKIFAGGDKPKDNFSKIQTENFNIPIFSNGEKNKGLYGYTNIAKVIKLSITISARGTIGYSVIRKNPFYPIIRLIVVTPNQKIIECKFLWYILNNFNFSNSGTSIPQLTVPMIKKYKIPLPSLPEQKQIVEVLDSLKEKTVNLEKNYQKELQNLEELKKIFLKKAFRGELV